MTNYKKIFFWEIVLIGLILLFSYILIYTEIFNSIFSTNISKENYFILTILGSFFALNIPFLFWYYSSGNGTD